MPGHVQKRPGQRADGSTRWQARWRHPDDASIRVERMFRRKEVAQRWIARQEADAHAGMYRDDRPAERRFDELVEAWRETRAPGLAPKSRARYEQVLRTHLMPEFKGRKVAALTREEVKRYFARLERDGMNPGTLQKVHTVLSAVFSEGIELGAVRVNPCTRALRGRKRSAQHEMLFLAPEEVTALAEAIDSRYRCLIYTAAWTGLRASELYGLRRRDVKLDRGVLEVRQSLKLIDGQEREPGAEPFGDLKSRTSRRTVPLPRFLRPLLAEHLAALSGGQSGDALVFTAPTGSPMRHNLFMRRYFAPAVKAGLPEAKHALRFHDLRHTYAALAIKARVYPDTLKRHMGHSSITTTMDRYGHMADSTHEETADALDGLHGAPPAPPLRAVE